MSSNCFLQSSIETTEVSSCSAMCGSHSLRLCKMLSMMASYSWNLMRESLRRCCKRNNCDLEKKIIEFLKNVSWKTANLNLKRRVQKCVVAGLNITQLLFNYALDSRVRRCVANNLSLSFAPDVIHSTLVRIDFSKQILKNKWTKSLVYDGNNSG
jgi:hypothetical protein